MFKLNDLANEYLNDLLAIDDHCACKIIMGTAFFLSKDHQNINH
ncbi:hypothetical protein BBROOKSOX_1085 [Bathymodiolus brooksi thiotrophic gill symbiont]|nr:hypothetical protein BBROOKSOX_1085 [Bathymodiolus brooksi thiotrophic gill symbiont]